MTVLGVVVVWWWAIGGTWLTVSTPSMGRYAPVGTLLWVESVDFDDIRVDDVITFHRPAAAGANTASARTYTHRVVAQNPDGTLQTKGDVNIAEDPWPVDGRDVVGRVTARWWGVGWLVEALPLLLPGGIGVWVLTAVLASRRSRAPLRVLGTAVLAAAAIYIYNPLFGATQLSFVPLGESGARATYVGTGLLPARLEADGAPSEVVPSGHTRSIVAPQEDDNGRYWVQVVPKVPWYVWVIVVAACLAPALWSVIVGVEPPPRQRKRRRWRRRRRRGVSGEPQLQTS